MGVRHRHTLELQCNVPGRLKAPCTELMGVPAKGASREEFRVRGKPPDIARIIESKIELVTRRARCTLATLLIHSIDKASCGSQLQFLLFSPSSHILQIFKSLIKFSLKLQKALCTVPKASFPLIVTPGVWLFLSSQ